MLLCIERSVLNSNFTKSYQIHRFRIDNIFSLTQNCSAFLKVKSMCSEVQNVFFLSAGKKDKQKN